MDAVHTNVIKRNGEEVNFDLDKIVNAINAANKEVDRLHQLNDYQVQAIADNIAKQIEIMTRRRYSGYGGDRNYGDAWIRGCPEVCALPV